MEKFAVALNLDTQTEPKLVILEAHSEAEALGQAMLEVKGTCVVMGYTVLNTRSQGNIDVEIVEALKQGHKIKAIKRYREVFGVGLKEAKEAIDDMVYSGKVEYNNQYN